MVGARVRGPGRHFFVVFGARGCGAEPGAYGPSGASAGTGFTSAPGAGDCGSPLVRGGRTPGLREPAGAGVARGGPRPKPFCTRAPPANPRTALPPPPPFG